MPRPTWIQLLWFCLVLSAPARSQDQGPEPAPEATPEGRASYLGRPIARTMHWTGADWLLRETREREENGELLREWLQVQPGQAVCDFGCGNGYHTLPLAKAVGEQGRVFAVDLQVPMLAMLRERLGEAGVGNVSMVEAKVDDPGLAANSCDLVLMVDVYHELTHPVTVLGHVHRALKPGGRLVLVEFRVEDPDVPIKPKHKMSKAQVVREMAANGFAWQDGFDGLPWQHAMSFTKVEAEQRGPRHDEAEVLGAFWRAVQAGEARVARAFLAPKVDGGRSRLAESADIYEDFAERVGDLTLERWLPMRADWRVSLCDGALLARKGDQLERVELTRDDQGRLEVSRWWRRRAAHPGPLVAMNTGTGKGTPEEQVELCAQLGYGGIGWGIWRADEVRAHCEARGMDLWSVYVVLDVAKQPDPREEQLFKAIAAMAGGPGQVWLALESSTWAKRDPAGDEAARETLARVLKVADEHGVEVALYPHFGSWMERAQDALRLIDAVEHPYLGLCFNLCHWLRNHPGADPEPVLVRAGERLIAVTINGADGDGTDWSTLIQPLDAGSFDQGAFLGLLERLKFDGPVGLQGFGLKLAPREHLTRSMAAWKSLGGR